jgi:hypothetical protein
MAALAKLYALQNIGTPGEFAAFLAAEVPKRAGGEDFGSGD